MTFTSFSGVTFIKQTVNYERDNVFIIINTTRPIGFWQKNLAGKGKMTRPILLKTKLVNAYYRRVDLRICSCVIYWVLAWLFLFVVVVFKVTVVYDTNSPPPLALQLGSSVSKVG